MVFLCYWALTVYFARRNLSATGAPSVRIGLQNYLPSRYGEALTCITMVHPMSSTRLSFKEMCAKFDVTPRTLRYYEYIELLQPEREGRSRFYHSRELARMKLIMRGRRFGFSLEDIRQWLELYDTGHENRAQMEKWIELADAQMGELNSRKEQIEEAISELQALRDDVAKGL